MDDEILWKEDSFAIVGAPIEVHNVMGFGFREKVYENSLVVELVTRGLALRQQPPIDVYYKNVHVGHFDADIDIECRILLEVKTCRAIIEDHVTQVLNYLKATGLKLGIILNFGPEKMTFRRVVN